MTDDWISLEPSDEDRVRVATLEEASGLWAHFAVIDIEPGTVPEPDVLDVAVARVDDVPESASIGDVFEVVDPDEGTLIASSWTGRYGSDGWTANSPQVGLNDAVDEDCRQAARQWRDERETEPGEPPIDHPNKG